MESVISPRQHAAMSRHSGRRFSLLDAMALLAATAAGLALDRAVWSHVAVWRVMNWPDPRDLAVAALLLSAPSPRCGRSPPWPLSFALREIGCGDCSGDRGWRLAAPRPAAWPSGVVGWFARC